MADDKKTEFEHLVITELQSISAQQQSVNKALVGLDKKLDLHVQSTQYELKAINQLDRQQNQLIDEHIDGVKTTRELIMAVKDSHNVRITKLEEPSLVKKYLVKWIITAGSIIGAIAAILKFLDVI